MKYLIPLISFLIACPSLFGADIKKLSKGAGSFICETAKQNNKKIIAVFPFTDREDQESPETKKATTLVIISASTCHIRIVDKSKLSKILNEQSLSQLGLVDDESAPETGKILGADTLIFGNLDTSSLQIKIIDATTGEILGASLLEPKSDRSGKTQLAVKKEDPRKSREKFRERRLKGWLKRTWKNRPGLFLYVTMSDDEWEAFSRKRPGAARRITGKTEDLPDDRKEKLKKVKMKIAAFRKNDPEFDRRIMKAQRNIFRRRGQRRRGR